MTPTEAIAVIRDCSERIKDDGYTLSVEGLEESALVLERRLAQLEDMLADATDVIRTNLCTCQPIGRFCRKHTFLQRLEALDPAPSNGEGGI